MTFDVIAAAASSASAVAASPTAVAADVVDILNADFAIAAVVFTDVATLALALGAPAPTTSDIAVTTCEERHSFG